MDSQRSASSRAVTGIEKKTSSSEKKSPECQMRRPRMPEKHSTHQNLRLPRQVLLWRYLDVFARPGVLQSSQCALTLYLGFQHRVLELLLLTGNSVLVPLNFLPLLFLQTVHGTSLELLQVRLNSVSSLRLRHCPPELHVPCRSLSGIDIRIRYLLQIHRSLLSLVDFLEHLVVLRILILPHLVRLFFQVHQSPICRASWSFAWKCSFASICFS